MTFLKKLFGGGDKEPPKAKKDGKPKWKDWTADNPAAKSEMRFWRNNRFMILMNEGKVEHVVVAMYLLEDDAKRGSPARKKEEADCRKQLKEMFGDIEAPIKFTTTDETVQDYLKRQTKTKA